jgi:hypothetical protein
MLGDVHRHVLLKTRPDPSGPDLVQQERHHLRGVMDERREVEVFAAAASTR